MSGKVDEAIRILEHTNQYIMPAAVKVGIEKTLEVLRRLSPGVDAPKISIMRDTERNKFIAIVNGTPIDIPINFMRVSEGAPMEQFIRDCTTALSPQRVSKDGMSGTR